jgi:ribosomal protein S18 acetylase RimI-like enzyme
MTAAISLTDTLEEQEVLALYAANRWSSAQKPRELLAALRNSHGLVTARVGGRLVGVGNAITDGHLVVYFPHLLVHPDFHRQGIGRGMMRAMLDRYGGFHQLLLSADGDAVGFYEAMGFEQAARIVSMWVYRGDDH